MDANTLTGFLKDKKLLENDDFLAEFKGSSPNETFLKFVTTGVIDENKLQQALVEHYNVNYVDISELVLPDNLIKKIPKKLLEVNLFIPTQLRNDTLTIAIGCPIEPQILEQLQLLLDCRVVVVVSKITDIVKTIKEVYNIGRLSHKSILDTADSDKVVNALVELLIERGVITDKELEDRIR